MTTAFSDCTDRQYQVLVPIELFGHVIYFWQPVDPDMPLEPQVKDSIGYQVLSNGRVTRRYVDYTTAKLGAKISI